MKKVKRSHRSSLQPVQSSGDEPPTYDADPDQARSFVLKLWIEHNSQNNLEIIWRGHVTEVITRKGRHVKSLEEISAYIIHQLQEMGGKNIRI